MRASLSPELSILFGKLRPAAPIAFGDLTLVPLLLDRAFDASADADLLEEGVLHGRTTVREAVDGTVRVTHIGARALLVVDGEQLLGANRDRIFNASFLVPPGSSVDLPVSFRDCDRADSSRDDRDDRVPVKPSAIQLRVEKLAPLPQQVGLATVRGDELVSMDVFGSPSLFARGWRKIVRGALSEVYERSVPSRDAVSVVIRALTTLSRLPVVRKSAPGLGEMLHGSHAGYVAGAVVHRRRLYHAVVAGQVQA